MCAAMAGMTVSLLESLSVERLSPFSSTVRLRAHDMFPCPPQAFISVMRSSGSLGVFNSHNNSACRQHQPATRRRKPRGYWADTGNLARELQEFTTENGPEDRMPTASQLLHAGRTDLCRAVQRHGGFGRVAELCGKTPARRRRGFWSEVGSQRGTNFLRGEISQLMQSTQIDRDKMPSAQMLRDCGRKDLVSAIMCAGGFQHVSRELGLRSMKPRKKTTPVPWQYPALRRQELPPHDLPKTSVKRKKIHYWDSWRNLEYELRSFANSYCEGHMPSQRQLVQSNRSDLLNAIRSHGGVAYVARRAGLTPALSSSGKRPKGHWTDVTVLHAELLTFTAKSGYPGMMPRRDQLLKSGRSDLVYAIRKHGGYSTIAAELHLIWHGPCSFWRVFRNVQKRLQAFLKNNDMGNTMPSTDELQKHGRLDLVYGIALHGGVMNVADRIGLRVAFPTRENGYWERPSNIQRELEDIIRAQPLEVQQLMPSSISLVQMGRADLATAIRDHGGWVYYAQRLGLRFAFDVRCQGFWQREGNVLTELLSYVSMRYGTWELPGKVPRQEQYDEAGAGKGSTIVPSVEMLKRDGRSDIAFAIVRYHGGMNAFAGKHCLTVAEDVVHTRPAEVLVRWKYFAKELRSWISSCGSVDIMPSKQDLIRTGRHDLRYAMYKHGSALEISRRLHLVIAATSVDYWLPAWLGSQAGKLGLLLLLRAKSRLSQTEKALSALVQQELNGRVVGQWWYIEGSSCVKTEDRLYGQSGRYRRGLTRHERSGVFTSISSSAKSERPTETPEELAAVRKRYMHLPPDDIIMV